MKSAPTPIRRVRFHSIHDLALRLVGGHAHSDSADLLHVLDLDVAVAETEKLVAAEFGRGDDALDEDGFREALVVVERAVDAAVEVAVDVEQLAPLRACTPDRRCRWPGTA